MVHKTAKQTKLVRSYYDPLRVGIKQPIVELLKLLRTAEVEIEENKLNSVSISDNNGGRIYF